MSNPSRRMLLKHASVLATLGLVPDLGREALAQPADAALEELSRDLSTQAMGQLVRPGNAEHAKITYYNARFDCVRSTTYVRPTTPKAVQAVIEWARRHKRTFAVRGAGHSFEGRSSHADLVIDMSRKTAIDFNANDGILRVEAGVQLGQVYDKLGAAGFVIPAGTCPTVGIVGHALGGGIGDFLPMFGYAAQSLLDVTLVTFGGTILKVSDEALEVLGGNPLPPGELKAANLMQALRGGGQGSFGVVTNMTFKAHDVRQAQMAGFKLDSSSSLPLPRATAVLQAWQTWRQQLPKPMQSLVSAKLNLSRAGNRYDFEIAGLVVIPAGTNMKMDAVRRALDPLFQIPELGKKSFSHPLRAPAAIASFIDTDETTHNRRRQKLYGSSSTLPAALPLRATQFLLQNLPSTFSTSLYTSGGKSLDGPATSLHPSEFMIEWTIYSPRRDTGAHRRIRAFTSEIMRRAGSPDQALPSYPDNQPRDYFTNRAALVALRKLLDPDALSTSSLLIPPPASSSATNCG